jgi:hypothetical protein
MEEEGIALVPKSGIPGALKDAVDRAVERLGPPTIAWSRQQGRVQDGAPRFVLLDRSTRSQAAGFSACSLRISA